MSKMSKERKKKYKEIGEKSQGLFNESQAALILQAIQQGYKLDSMGFVPHPGFFQAPHRRDLTGVDIAMVGCPMSMGGFGGLSGGRHGPRAIREWTRHYGPVSDSTGNNVFLQCSVIDYGDIEWSACNVDAMVDDIYKVFKELAESDITPLACGGEHTITFPIIKALSEAHDNEAFGMIHLDAHCDSMGPLGADVYHDGMIFRLGVLEGYIDPEHSVEIGTRGRATPMWDFSHDAGVTIITADEVYRKGIQYVIDKTREVIGTEPTYFSLDVDVLDSSIMMGTGGMEPFGLTGREVREIILGARTLNIIGADLVELNPYLDQTDRSSHLAAGLFFELLCLLADAREKRMGKQNPTTWE